MKLIQQVFTGFLIILPLVFSILVVIYPIPNQLVENGAILSKAQITNNRIDEQNALEEMLQVTPWRADLWKRLGRIYLDTGAYTEATRSLQTASSLLKEDLELKLWTADALISEGRWEEAKNQLRDTSQNESADMFTLLQTALLQRKIGDTYGSLTTLLTAASQSPENMDVRYQLGLQLSISQPDSALRFLSETQNSDPSKQYVSSALISIIEQTKDTGNTAERFIYIGQTLAKFEEWDLAQLAFISATTINPNNAAAWALMAESAQQNGQDGFIYLQKSQEIDSESEIVNGVSALYYRRQNKNELAIHYFEKALEANPSSTTWEIEIANTFSNLGDLSNALKHYQKAVELNPEDWFTLKSLAVFCIRYNYKLKEIGLPAARKALELQPDSPVLLDLLGSGLLASGDYDSAEKFFLQANQIDPNQAAILIHLGQVYLAKGDIEQARIYLITAGEFAPDERLRDMANQLLAENSGK